MTKLFEFCFFHKKSLINLLLRTNHGHGNYYIYKYNFGISISISLIGKYSAFFNFLQKKQMKLIQIFHMIYDVAKNCVCSKGGVTLNKLIVISYQCLPNSAGQN